VHSADRSERLSGEPHTRSRYLSVDCVHWSDPIIRKFLAPLIDRVPTLRVPRELRPPWIGGPHARLLSLSLLLPRQRAEMIAHVSGGKTLPEEISAPIIDRTDGGPLFIEELTKCVVESGLWSMQAIDFRRADRWRCRQARRLLGVSAEFETNLR